MQGEATQSCSVEVGLKTLHQHLQQVGMMRPKCFNAAQKHSDRGTCETALVNRHVKADQVQLGKQPQEGEHSTAYTAGPTPHKSCPQQAKPPLACNIVLALVVCAVVEALLCKCLGECWHGDIADVAAALACMQGEYCQNVTQSVNLYGWCVASKSLTANSGVRRPAYTLNVLG